MNKQFERMVLSIPNAGFIFYSYEDGITQLGGHFEQISDHAYSFLTTRYNTEVKAEHGEIVARWIIKPKTNRRYNG